MEGSGVGGVVTDMPAFQFPLIVDSSSGDI